MRALLFLLFFSATLSAHASCLEQGPANALLSEFRFVNESGDALKPDLCQDQTTAFHTLKTLIFIQALPKLELEKSEFNPDLIGASPFEFFKSRVREVVVVEDSKSERCPDERLAFVSPVSREDKKIFICPNARLFDAVVFSSALIHEARHLDGPEFAHRPCAAGPHKEAFSCDDRYSDGGAYAIGLEYLVRLAKSKTVDTTVRDRARQLAVVDFLQRFNELPLDIQTGALLRTEANELFFYDGKASLKLPLKVSTDTRLVLQGGLATFFDPSNAQTQQFSFTSGLTPASSDVLVDLFQKWPKEKRAGLLDVAYGKTEACLLLRDSLECFGRDKTVFSKSLEGLKPKKFLVSNQTRLMEPGVLSLVLEDGSLRRLPPDASDLKNQPTSAWQSSKSDLRAIQPWIGGEVALGADGSLSLLNYHSRKWAPAPGTPPSKVRDLLAPFYWSKALQGI